VVGEEKKRKGAYAFKLQTTVWRNFLQVHGPGGHGEAGEKGSGGKTGTGLLLTETDKPDARTERPKT